MKWFNLKNNKCPKCNKDFVVGLQVRGELLGHTCGFNISQKRYKEIVSSMVNAELEEKWDNEELEKIEKGEK